ncbi:MAG TPA: thiamine pyrophosphate-dependent enzyme [Candidatus Limnocylindrales bacterium]|nr:thiamine pyrophosphate-dependent enzyme [Candidatus Limnocylindrales bacterium]
MTDELTRTPEPTIPAEPANALEPATPIGPASPIGPAEPAAPDHPDESPIEPGLPNEPPPLEVPGRDNGSTPDEVPPLPGAERSAEPPAAPRTVARLIADALRAAGVKFAFTVPGESFLGLLESFPEAGIHVIATRHESGAAFMAEAYGQLTGRPAACLATRAVGASNLAIGIHTARADSSPMFALVGQADRGNRGREAFQEVDLAGTIGGLATWAGEIAAPEHAATVVADAVRQATGGRPGPVLVSCPEDVLDLEVPAGTVVPVGRAPTARLDHDAMRAVLQLVATAERPVILAGAGILRARCSRELVRFAELLRVPVVASWRRPDVFPNDHPLYLGMSGYFAPRSARDRLLEADAVLAIGCRLNEPTTFDYRVPATGVPWAHVDLAPRVAGHGLTAADVAVTADAGVFLRAAISRLERGVLDVEQSRRREAATARARSEYEAQARVDGGDWSGPGVHPGQIVATLRAVLPDDAIITTDAGNFGGWLARGYRFRRPGTFLGPTSGAMGYALPAAIAAAIVHRDRPVVAVAGDGGFAMTMNELETAVRERVRPVVVVFDNQRYGTIRMHQDRRGGDGVGTDLGPIDFVRAAEAFGARGVLVDTTDAFEPALRDALAGDRPTVLHLPLDRRWISVDDLPTARRNPAETPSAGAPAPPSPGSIEDRAGGATLTDPRSPLGRDPNDTHNEPKADAPTDPDDVGGS